MSDELPFLTFSRDGDRGRVILVNDVVVAVPAELIAAAPVLATPAGLPRYCDALNYFAHGIEYRMIHDPVAFAAKYQRRLNAEDLNAPWQEGVVRLSDFGLCDLSEIRPPHRDNGSVVFYVEDDYLGIPYRVTAPPPDHPEGNLTYVPLPMTELPMASVAPSETTEDTAVPVLEEVAVPEPPAPRVEPTEVAPITEPLDVPAEEPPLQRIQALEPLEPIDPRELAEALASLTEPLAAPPEAEPTAVAPPPEFGEPAVPEAVAATPAPAAEPPTMTPPPQRVEPAAPEVVAPTPILEQPPMVPPQQAPPPPPATAVVPPKPPPLPLELLRKAVAREDQAAIQQHLLTLGLDKKVCERLLAAWQSNVPVPAPRPPTDEESFLAPTQPVSSLPQVPSPTAAVVPPKPPPPPPPSSLELLRDAIDREDQAAAQQHLLTLGVDKKVCERLLAAWQDIVAPSTLFAERQTKMLELTGLIRPLTALPKVQDELWRLQKLLTNYN